MEFFSSHCSHVVPFSQSLVEERGLLLSNGNQSVDPGSLVGKYFSWWLNTFLRINEELEGSEKNLQKTKSIKIVMWETYTKKTEELKTREVIFSSYWFCLLFSSESDMTILLALVFSSSFQFFLVLLLVLRNGISSV